MIVRMWDTATVFRVWLGCLCPVQIVFSVLQHAVERCLQATYKSKGVCVSFVGPIRPPGTPPGRLAALHHRRPSVRLCPSYKDGNKLTGIRVGMEQRRAHRVVDHRPLTSEGWTCTTIKVVNGRGALANQGSVAATLATMVERRRRRGVGAFRQAMRLAFSLLSSADSGVNR